MKGIVEVYRGKELIDFGSNMILDQTGELIVDMLTAPRALSGIPSASAILDTSNYTVRAASIGKDVTGYNYHAHHPTLAVNTSADGIVRVVSYEAITVSSYHTSAFASSTQIPIYPEASNPRMTRLESRSTLTTAIGSGLDTGHNSNLIPSGSFGAVHGCFAPQGNLTVYLLSSLTSPNLPIVSATLNNVSGYNAYPYSIDSRGFIHMNLSSIQEGRGKYDASSFDGLLMTHEDNWNNTSGDQTIKFIISLAPQDIICNNFYGGIYNIGLWGFNMKEMLASGLLPPYSREQGDDIQFKLLARKTFTKDLTYYNDVGSSAGLNNVSERLEIIWRWVFKYV